MAAPHNKTLVAITFERYPHDVEYEKVPPHITVMPWFDASSTGVKRELSSTIADSAPFSISRAEPIVVGGEEHKKRAISVYSQTLVRLHREMFIRLVAAGAEFSHPEWLGNNYLPHYREQDPDPFENISTITVSELAIVTNIVASNAVKGTKTINYQTLGQK